MNIKDRGAVLRNIYILFCLLVDKSSLYISKGVVETNSGISSLGKSRNLLNRMKKGLRIIVIVMQLRD